MVEGSVLFASLIQPVLLFPAGFAIDLAAIERIADSFAPPAILFLFAIIRHHGGLCDKDAPFPEVEVIRHGQNRGYSAALKSGIMSTKYDLIFFSDSDGQFDFRDLEQLIFWSEDYDIVAGYRAKRQEPLYRRINALGWNVLVRLVLGIKLRNIDCAFKVFRRSVFDHVQIRCVGAMVNTEILAQATQLGMRIRKFKVSYFPRRQGKQSGTNVHVVIKAFRELCRPLRKLRQVAPDQGDSILRLRTLRPQLIYECL